MFTQIHKPINTPILQPSINEHLEVNRLLATAVVDRQFREQLLNEPEAALDNGYLDTPFLLSSEDRAMILSIQADSLQELARRLLAFFSKQPVRVRLETYAVIR